MIFDNYFHQLFLWITIFLFLIPSLASSGTNNREKINEHKSSLEKALQSGDKVKAASFYNKIGYIHWQEKNLDAAIDQFESSLNLNREIGNANALKNLHSNLGLIYSEKQQYGQALSHFKQGLQVNKQLGKKGEVAGSLVNIGLTLQSMGRYKESNIHLKTAIEIAEETNNIRLLKNCYSLMADNYQHLGKNGLSLEYFNKYASLEKHLKTKEIQSIETKKQKAEQEIKEKEKKLKQKESALVLSEKISQGQQMKIELLDKENKLKELAIKEEKARLRSARIMTYSLITGAGLLILIALMLYRGIKQKQRTNARLEEQNKEILDQQTIIEKKNKNITNSINYAKRIQKAMLPPKENLAYYLPESFIFFKPRDIVSGDFFYFSALDTQSNLLRAPIMGGKMGGDEHKQVNQFVLSAIDCTGHGVPGAFMSTIGFNLIGEIIATGIREPDQILNYLHQGVKNLLKQDKTDNRDGMDMTLCTIDKDKKELKFAGAKNPLVYFQNNEIHEIRGDLFPIGGIERKGKQRQFTSHKLQIDQPTTCYIFSDGFQDQIGGEKGKKYMSRNFKNLLHSIHTKPFDEQKDLLDQELTSWMGEKYNQIDDIIVIGFKINPNT